MKLVFIAGFSFLTILSVFSLEGYGDIDLSFTYLLFDEDTPEHIREEYSFMDTYNIVTGIYGVHPLIYEFSVDYSRKNDTDLFGIHAAFIQWGNDWLLISLGKRKTVWGEGLFSHPSYYLDFAGEGSGRDYEAPNLWSLELSLYSRLGISSLTASLDDSFELFEEPSWYSGCLRHEYFNDNLNLHILSALLYKNRTLTGEFGLDAQYYWTDELYSYASMGIDTEETWSVLLGLALMIERFTLTVEACRAFDETFYLAVPFSISFMENKFNLTFTSQYDFPQANFQLSVHAFIDTGAMGSYGLGLTYNTSSSESLHINLSASLTMESS